MSPNTRGWEELMAAFNNSDWYRDRNEQGKRVAQALWTENDTRDYGPDEEDRRQREGSARVVRQIVESWREQHPDGPRFSEDNYDDGQETNAAA
jgi:hypothetical protein